MAQPYRSENVMLEAFTAHARSRGWRVFPETAGFDTLLVATDAVEARGIKPGDQVGVEAKLAPNIKVLAQAAPNNKRQGPNFHLALVPHADRDFRWIASVLGVMVVNACRDERRGRRRVLTPSDFRYELGFFPVGLRQYYPEPCWHPEVEIWVPSGVRSPRRITPWKVKAIKLCVLARSRGYLTSADFKADGVSMGRWFAKCWLVDTGKRQGRNKKYALSEDPMTRPPHLEYPEIYAAVIADTAKEDPEVLASVA